VYSRLFNLEGARRAFGVAGLTLVAPRHWLCSGSQTKGHELMEHGTKYSRYRSASSTCTARSSQVPRLLAGATGA
jgi:hypothetical protein